MLALLESKIHLRIEGLEVPDAIPPVEEPESLSNEPQVPVLIDLLAPSGQRQMGKCFKRVIPEHVFFLFFSELIAAEPN